MWSYGAIAKLAAMGVVEGDGPGTFNPDRILSHEEAVTMALRFMGSESQLASSGGTSSLESSE